MLQEHGNSGHGAKTEHSVNVKPSKSQATVHAKVKVEKVKVKAVKLRKKTCRRKSSS